MNPLRIRSAIVLAAPLLPLAPLGAQTAPEPIVTDRPSESAGPSVVPRFALQIEAGYKFSRFDQGEKRTDTQQLPDLLLRYGAFERIEARLTMTGFSFKNLGSPEACRKEVGFNDVSIGAKWALVDEQGRRPAVSLLGDLSFPVGDAEFTDDFVNPKLLLPLILSYLLIGGLFDILMGLTTPIADLLPASAFPDVWVHRFTAAGVLVVISLLVGVIDQSAVGSRVGRSFENKILMRFAPYALLRSLSRRLFGKDVPGQLQPALLSVSPDVRTLAFIVEEHTDGEFTLFVPLAAAPGVGNIQIVSATKVE